MDSFRFRLVIWWVLGALVLCFLSTVAHAGYAQVQPPPGFSGNSGTGWFYRKAANEAWIGNTVRTTASLNVGGQAVKIPAAMRLAANAGRFSAGLAFGNPWVIGAAVVGTALYDYYNAHGIVSKDGMWQHPTQVMGQGEWWIQGNTGWQHAKLLMDAAALAWPGMSIREGSGAGVVEVLVGAGTNNAWWWPNTGEFRPSTVPETQYEVLTRTGMETLLGNDPVPSEVPRTWPDPQPVEWPVEAPILNPSPALEPQPMRVPTGNPVPIPLPVPNPNNDPQRWREPVVDITPAPTPEDPWRVDLTPRDITNDSPTPSPIGTPAPVTDPNAPPQTEKQPGLCDQYPDILACQKVELGELTPDTIPDDRRVMAITPSSGWGPSNGSCPAPRTAVVMGKTISMPFTGLCDFANAIRPLIIGMAWLSAALIFMGLGRKE